MHMHTHVESMHDACMHHADNNMHLRCASFLTAIFIHPGHQAHSIHTVRRVNGNVCVCVCLITCVCLIMCVCLYVCVGVM